MPTITCYSCQKPYEVSALRLSFSESCPKCSRDLHVCKQCSFHDLKSYNECREPQAERVVDKEKRNYCEYFNANNDPQNKNSATSDSALKKLDDLFK